MQKNIGPFGRGVLWLSTKENSNFLFHLTVAQIALFVLNLWILLGMPSFEAFRELRLEDASFLHQKLILWFIIVWDFAVHLTFMIFMVSRHLNRARESENKFLGRDHNLPLTIVELKSHYRRKLEEFVSIVRGIGKFIRGIPGYFGRVSTKPKIGLKDYILNFIFVWILVSSLFGPLWQLFHSQDLGSIRDLDFASFGNLMFSAVMILIRTFLFLALLGFEPELSAYFKKKLSPNRSRTS